MEKLDWKLAMLILKNLAAEKNITYQQIADKTGLKQSNVARMMSVRYKPRLDLFLDVAQAIGLDISLRDPDGGYALNRAYENANRDLIEINKRDEEN